jgi:hypothetical protein
MPYTHIGEALAAADERRIRLLRRGAFRVAGGVVLIVGAWLVLPLGIYQLVSAPVSVVSVVEVVAGVALLAAGVAVIVNGMRVRRAAVRVHAPETPGGRGNPRFDEDRKSLPTGGVPISWIGGVPGS